MATERLGLATRLLAGLGGVFAFTRTMTVFPTGVRAAFEWLPAYLTAARICQPAGHIFQHLLAALALLLRQEWALRTAFVVGMAVVRGLGVTAWLRAFTLERASRWLRATRLERKQDRASAITRDLLEDRFPAGVAGTLVTELRAGVSPAFQRSTTNPGADMLCLDVFVNGTKVWFELAASSLAFNGPLFSGTASFRASVATAMQSRFAYAETLRRLHIALMAYSRRCRTATLALNRDAPQA